MLTGGLLLLIALSTAASSIIIKDDKLYKLQRSLAFIIDEQRRLDIDKVSSNKQLIFKPYLKTNMNIISKPVWLRFEIINPKSYTSEFLFIIPHVWQGTLNFYYPNEGGYKKIDYKNVANSSTSNFIMPFTLAPGKHTLYLELETNMPRAFVPEVGTTSAYSNERRSFRIVSVFVTGFLTAMILYAVFAIKNIGGESNREAYFYFLYVVSTLLLGCYLNGYLSFLGTYFLSLTYTTLVWLWSCTLAIITVKYFSINQKTTYINKIVWAAIAANGFIIYLIPVIDNQYWYTSFSVSFFLVRILPLIISIYYFKKGFQGAGLFILAITIDFSAVVYMVSGVIGWLDYSSHMLPILEIGNALAVLIIGFALSNKLQIDSLTKSKLEHEAQLAKLDSHMKSEFLATMSHEIRTPINGILGMAQLLQDSSLSKGQQGKLNIILESGKSLLMIINDILDFSKIESGKLKIINEDFNIETLGGYLTSFFGPSAKEKNTSINLIYAQPDIPLSLIGDFSRIKQVANNLLSNAIKFTENGTITITIDYKEHAEDTLVLSLSVSDNGIGMTEKQLKIIFDPFLQADGSISRKYGGTGLGLSICKKIANLLGGDITVKSTEGEGSIFTFTCNCTINQEKEKIRLDNLKKIANKSLQISTDKKYIQRALTGFFEHNKVTVSSSHTLKAQLEKKEKSDFFITDIDGLIKLSENEKRQLTQAAESILIIVRADQDTIKLPKTNNKLAFFHSPFPAADMVDFFTKKDSPTDYQLRDDREPAIDFSQLTVLCAEDNPVNMQVIKGMLAKLNIKASFAINGIEAIDYYKRDHPTIILMDCEMPDMDGLEATRAIRQWEKDNDLTPIIIIALTAHAFSQAKDQCLAAGMDDVITKPILIPDLTQKLSKYLN